MKSLTIKAPAKINLYLDVLGVRNDGYHELDMIMAPISLYDIITIKIEENDKITFINEDVGPMNTVSKAVNLFKERYHIEEKIHITVTKNIPSEAGLGGGSSDAANVLIALNKLFKTRANIYELKEIAVSIGADTPFFIDAKPSRCEGLGEKLTPIKIKNKYYCLLVKPNKGCSTGKVYKTLKIKEQKCSKIDDLIYALKKGDDEAISALIRNELEEPAIKEVGEIQNIKTAFLRKGFKIVMMTGSGSCVFCLSRHKKKLQEIQKEMEVLGKTYLTKILKQ